VTTVSGAAYQSPAGRALNDALFVRVFLYEPPKEIVLGFRC